MKKPLVSIVLITWNGEKLLKQYLYSIANLKYSNLEVIIVDNGSDDDSVAYIKRSYPGYRVVKSNVNMGTSGGSNIGADYAKGKYIFFTSNDMVYDRYLIDAMILPLERDQKCGAVACKVRYMDEKGAPTDIIDSVGGDIDIFGFPNIRGNRQEDTGQYERSLEVFFAFGCSILIRNDVFREVGGYDSKLFTLADDIDLCWRARLLGYSVYYEPKALLFHRGSATINSIFKRSQTRYMSERHTLRMLIKNYSCTSLLYVLPVYFFLLGLEFCFYMFTGKVILAKSIIRALLWNVKNTKDTLTERKKVQKNRNVEDSEIIKSMAKFPNKFREFLDFISHSRNEYWQNFFGKKNTV
jgi:GT2 family glycosyltransferase